MKQDRCLGLIGGLAVGATVHYYRELAKAHEAMGAELRLLMIHADMPRVLGYVQQGDVAALAHYFAGLIAQLKAGGADLAAIASVTPHICIGELTAITPLPIVNVIHLIRNEILTRGIRRVALFGTRFTIESKLFGQLEGVDVVMPRPDEVQFIHDTYLATARDGVFSAQHHQALTTLARTLCDRDNVEAVILAGTDLSMLFNEANTDFPHLDCSRLHIHAITKALFETTQ